MPTWRFCSPTRQIWPVARGRSAARLGLADGLALVLPFAAGLVINLVFLIAHIMRKKLELNQLNRTTVVPAGSGPSGHEAGSLSLGRIGIETFHKTRHFIVMQSVLT